MDLEDRPFFYDDALGSYDWTDIWKPEIEKSISNLQYDDTHFFTIDDYQLFLPMYDTIPFRFKTNRSRHIPLL